MQQIDNNQRLRFQLTLYLILFISFSTAIILKNNQELRMNIIEKVNLVYNFAVWGSETVIKISRCSERLPVL